MRGDDSVDDGTKIEDRSFLLANISATLHLKVFSWMSLENNMMVQIDQMLVKIILMIL